MSTAEILTDIEAAQYVKAVSLRSFKDWCRKWSVRRVGQRRYARTHLDAGILRQVAQGRKQYNAAAK